MMMEWKQGDRETLEIVDLGTSGEGIGRLDGMAVFVPGTIPGDHVLVELEQVKKNFAYGKTVELLKPSEWRVEPLCRYAGVCGGCPLQSMSYPGQLELKRKWVSDRLARIGGVSPEAVLPVIGMVDCGKGESETGGECLWRYRNKAQFPVGRVSGADKKIRGCNIGYHKARSREIINCESCLLQAEPAEVAARVIREYVKEEKVPVYDAKSGTGLLRHVIVRTAFGTGEVMVILVATDRRLPGINRLVERLNEEMNRLSEEMNRKLAEDGGLDEGGDYGYYLESVILNVNRKKTGEVMGRDCVTLAGKPTIRDYLCGMEFEISPLSFYQVNPVQMERLYGKVREYAALTGKETVLDLYCGVGTIGLYLAAQAKRVIGIEVVKAAVLDANRNATINGIVNAEYLCGKAEEVLPRLVQEGGSDGKPVSADVVILDPPRAGSQRPLLDAVISVGPDRIVYVSCDPATLARDVKVLGDGGYQVVEVQPIDMFVWTGHCESVVLLQRKG